MFIDYNDNTFLSFILEKSAYYFNGRKAFGQSYHQSKDPVIEVDTTLCTTEAVPATTESTGQEEKELYDFVYDNDKNNKDSLETLFETSLLKPSEEYCRECVVECDADKKSSQPLKNIEEQQTSSDVKTFCVNEVNAFLEKRRKQVYLELTV